MSSLSSWIILPKSSTNNLIRPSFHTNYQQQQHWLLANPYDLDPISKLKSSSNRLKSDSISNIFVIPLLLPHPFLHFLSLVSHSLRFLHNLQPVINQFHHQNKQPNTPISTFNTPLFHLDRPSFRSICLLQTLIRSFHTFQTTQGHYLTLGWGHWVAWFRLGWTWILVHLAGSTWILVEVWARVSWILVHPGLCLGPQNRILRAQWVLLASDFHTQHFRFTIDHES